MKPISHWVARVRAGLHAAVVYPFLLLFYERRYELAPHLNGMSIVWYVLFQKILNLNGSRCTGWPVHWTSVVTGNVTAGYLSSPGMMPGIYVNGAAGVAVGKGVFIGPGVKIVSINHVPGDPVHHREQTTGISVGDGVWLGANSVILPGVTIGRCSTVGAGAVVTKDVEEGIVVGGVPARVIGRCERTYAR